MEKTKLKNYIIRNLMENGLENTTDHEISAAHAYKVFKFRDEIAKAYKDMEDKRQKLVKDAGIEDGQKFDERRKELEAKERSDEEQKELDEMLAKLNKFGKLYSELLNDESELNVKTIPFEEYHALAKENRRTLARPGKEPIYIDFFTAFRNVLKGVLWEEPKEEEE